MRRALLTTEQIQDIAAQYDGTTETIDKLVAKYQVKRHNIINAARISGYTRSRARINWTPEKDQWLRENYGRVPMEEVLEHLGCSYASIRNRLKRIHFSTRQIDDLTIRDIEELTKIDHRLWQRFIDAGWLKAWEQHGYKKVEAVRVSLPNLKKFFTEHPEVFDYQSASTYVKGVLELHELPAPPRFKRVTCTSESWKDGERLTPMGKHDVETGPGLAMIHHSFTMETCSAIGGVNFWAPTYAVQINCPRCGCLVSRFSDSAIYTNEDPGEGDVLKAIASKLDLTFKDGQFFNAEGEPVEDEKMLRYVFSTNRTSGDAFKAFRKLLEIGMKIAPPQQVESSYIEGNILGYDLRPNQQLAFDSFLQNGNIGVYWPPGQGKMYFLGMVFTRIPGRHILFVNNDTIREQWCAFFASWAPSHDIRLKWKPKHHQVSIREANDAERCKIEIYTYQTAQDFSHDQYVVAGFDEAHFLPGNNAHRLSLINSQFRVGLTATPFREDGRSDLIQMMTGQSIGEDWSELREAGALEDVPIRVLIVQDMEHKYRALRKILAKRKTIVFSDYLECGERVALENDIPFIHAATHDRLEMIRKHQVVCMSRVGDCGIDIQDLEEVIEFTFQRGSRNQELQRYGRLLHSRNPVQHTVMMTRLEFSRYSKRLQSLEARGFKFSIEVFSDPCDDLPPIATHKTVNPWLQILGMREVLAA
jgi:hypothetical protein